MEIMELIRCLEYCSNIENDCYGCARWEVKCEGVTECAYGLMKQAVEALTAQQKRIAELEAQKRWIPVTERVPEPEKRVLILTTVKHCTGKLFQEIMCGFYEDGNVWCEDSKATWGYEMKREENYDENRDDYRVPEGWFEELLNVIDDHNCVQIGDTVTHWMPLPEPTKEVTR